MKEKLLHIPAISCQHCVATIKRELAALEGVEVTQSDLAAKTIVIKWDSPAMWEGIVALLREIGYPPTETVVDDAL